MYELDVIRGKLPNPLIFDDNTRVATHEDWIRRRAEYMDRAIELEFGGMPPEPEFLEIDVLHTPGIGRTNTYRIFTGTRACPTSFILTVHLPGTDGKHPVLLTGDGCYRNCSDAVIDEALRRDMVVAVFNRTELAPDIFKMDRVSGIYRTYPDTHFSAISAWAWGYSRAVDALLCMDFVDPDEIAITGHSRGGKTVLLAGACDERIKYINPNNSGAHGCGCYRYEQNEAEGKEKANEKLEFLFMAVPYWMGQNMQAYIGKEETLPHDMHFFKALCAPRYLLETNGREDIWSNPRGSYQTYLGARRVYETLGCADHIATYYREGGHKHKYEDFVVFMDFIECVREGKPLPSVYTEHPYPGMEFMGMEND